MTLAQYIFQRGEPVVLADLVESGTLLAGHTMRARMKPVAPQHRDLMPGAGVAAVVPVFTSERVAASGAVPAHFLHSLTPAQSAQVAAGEYLFDSSLLLDGVVQQTSEPVRIVLRDAASAVIA